ncbi:MAG: dTDP-4-dehydrorhamnose 3,5-epimerase [Chitinophagaceae bacterium]
MLFIMIITETFIKGLFIIQPRLLEDQRGYFFESYNQKALKNFGIDTIFVQDNQAYSKNKNIVRGLHFQKPPFAQTKLIRCLQGGILDVAVDIRKNSPTYGKYFSIILSEENKKQLYIPHGFAHGYSVITETTEVLYKCDNFYNLEVEGGIRFDDKSINIDWHIPIEDIIAKKRDKNFPFFKDLQSPF